MYADEVTENLPGQITDPKALRALSHPTRWKLIELLGLEATATATRCAEFTGESVASCSYHLGILAKYGFVEHADDGQGREKPWRSTVRQFSVSSEGMEPDAALAAEVVSEVFLDHELGRMKEYIRRASREPEQWNRIAGATTATVHITADELQALGAELQSIIDRFEHRGDDPAQRPEGSRPVRLFLSTYLPPLPPTKE